MIKILVGQLIYFDKKPMYGNSDRTFFLLRRVKKVPPFPITQAKSSHACWITPVSQVSQTEIFVWVLHKFSRTKKNSYSTSLTLLNFFKIPKTITRRVWTHHLSIRGMVLTNCTITSTASTESGLICQWVTFFHLKKSKSAVRFLIFLRLSFLLYLTDKLLHSIWC